MTAAASDSSTGETQEFLDRVFDRAVRRVEEGHTPIIDELLEGHESLRADVERLVRVASQIATGPVRRMPVIGGYEVLHELGHGGMGTVYLARQESLGGRPVALKVLPVSAGLSPRARDRFTFEARAIARLRHPHIVAIHDVIEEGGFCAYAMEWVDGASLATCIDEQAHGRELEAFPRLDVAAICRLGVSIARALAAVHETGILHRDVKPSNILLRRDGTALLADFGLAREVDSSIHTQDGRFAGTVAYAPPEQLRGDTARVDARSDIYALGVTMYHALALRLPFEAREPVAMLRQIESGLSTPLRKFNPRVPRDLETIITKAIDPDPARRYQAAQEFAEDLERLLGFQPIHARRAGVMTRGLKLLRRNRPAAIGVGIGSLITVLIAAGLVSYFFFVPGWVAGHVRNARLALLDPDQANSIVSVLYWGRDKSLAPTEEEARKQALNKSLTSYDKALLWSPIDKEIRREREVVQLAGDQETKQRSDVSRFPDPRDRGLFAFLTNDFDTAIKTWEQYEQSRDPLAQPDPLLDSAIGVLYLFKDQPARAYPRLQQAVIAFPRVGFLLEYLADAAAKCGDAERAEHWLNEAKKLTLGDPHGAQNRIRASILAATGHDDEAEALFRNAPPHSPAGIEYARFLEIRGRLPEALARYSASASVMRGERVQREFIAAADRWWAGLNPRQRLNRISTTLDESPFAPDSFVVILRQYRNSKKSIEPSAAKNVDSLPPWPIDPSAHFILSLLATVIESISSPSLQSHSLSELAERMEVNDMLLWNRFLSNPTLLKRLQIVAWRSPWPRAGSETVKLVDGFRRLSRFTGPRNVFLWVWASSALIANSAKSQAQDFSYNYESLNIGDVVGQDGWTLPFPVWHSPRVASGVGINTSRTQRSNNPSADAASGAKRPLPQPFFYSTSDTDAVWRVQGLLNSHDNNRYIFCGLSFGPKLPLFGMGADFNQAIERTYINSSTGAMYGDSLLIQNWYEFELHVDFSLPGARATLKYRNLTTGQTSFTVDSILQNVNLGLIADGSGSYQADYVFTRNDSGSMSDTYLDNLFFQAPAPTCESPQVSQNPQSATITAGANANFTVAASGTEALSYQWRKNTVNLNNGASGCSSTISGATTANLTITNVSTSDNAAYDCVVTNPCGSDTSDPATLTVPAGPACVGDMDGNNVVNGADISPFVAKLLAGGSCP